jgi:hypothetical protein
LFEEVGSPYKSYAQEACERVAPELASANATDLKTKDLATLCDWALEEEFAKG